MIAPRGYRPAWWRFALDLARFVLATAVAPSARRVWSWLSREGPPSVLGAENVPIREAYVLALNHFSDGASGAVVLAALDAVASVDPSAIDRVLLVAGRRDRPIQSTFRRMVRQFGRHVAGWIRRRWREHLVVLSMEGSRADLGALRAWRRLALERVSVVYPEGIARVSLGAMRPGVGQWLASLGVKTVPCAVWFDDGRWNVRIGRPVAWTKNARARDAQLGLALAALLPEALQGDWTEDLERVARLRRASAERVPSREPSTS
ncbi:MAG: hypothetical protein JNK05_38660 [Myxococcales bacterium]|nr:hypothetical protein [Myxococcales bacterium]